MRKVKVSKQITDDKGYIINDTPKLGWCYSLNGSYVIVEYEDGSINAEPLFAVTFLDKPEEDNNQLRDIVTQLMTGCFDVKGSEIMIVEKTVRLAKEIIRQTS